MKTCFKCSRSLALAEFYRHPAMADGYLGKCKDCTRIDTKSNRREKIEKYRAYDRERASLPHRRANSNRVSNRWRQADKRRDAAHNGAARFYKDGPQLCEMCGLPKRLQKHHPDYDQPLLILWLCKPCHVQADKVRRLLEQRKEKAS